jgi:hypothetical protein
MKNRFYANSEYGPLITQTNKHRHDIKEQSVYKLSDELLYELMLEDIAENSSDHLYKK